uniref:Olfactory receptor family 2 subfamily C member 3 n=1 Tax=Saimiri boliviensis boliviensis TaxID=39432 RepID=A0A2K6TV71_SAIBB
MEITDVSSPKIFVLLGFSAQPSLETVLLVVVLGDGIIVPLPCVDVRLHTPMDLFLASLSFLDISFTTSIVPQRPAHLWGPQKTVSSGGCVAQFCVSHWLGAPEPVLPLPYAVIKHPRLCLGLALVSRLGGLTTSMVGSTLCGNNRVDHFFCEMPLITQPACVDTSFDEVETHLASFVFVVRPLGLILVSYGHAAWAVWKIKSAEGRRRACNTCSSHVPARSTSHEQGKFIALFYTVVTPALNPLIYTPRNTGVKNALQHTVSESCCGSAGTQALI